MLDTAKNSLDVVWTKPDSIDSLSVLGSFGFGEPTSCHPVPFAWIDMPLLGNEDESAIECWRTAKPVKHGSSGAIEYAVTDDYVFGTLSYPDNSFLDETTEKAYSELLNFLSDNGFIGVWRLWNHIRDINAEECGLERYKRFNLGRQAAFEKAVKIINGQMPAASAVGTKSGPLIIGFLAGKSAPRLIENPVQVSAYEYPGEYGPQSPSFSRAAIAPVDGNELLLISGTASIVGFKTVHAGKPYEQTVTALGNIKILAEAAQDRASKVMDIAKFYYRVYVRNPSDFPLVQRAFADFFDGASVAHYVQADICRSDLLVEIEAVGYAK
jgi:enamine deaminase RidA (YjgF/YER057c/UK114 family)